MMNTRRAAVLIALVLAFVVVCVWLFQTRLLNGCVIGGCAPPRLFRVTDLSVPAHLFPPGATTIGMQPDSPDGDLEVMHQGQQLVAWPGRGTGAGYHVYRCFDNVLAANRYAIEKQQLNAGHPGNFVPRETPPSLTYRSPKTRQFHVACGTFIAYQCSMVARYEEYVVRFNTGIDAQMTEQRFEEIVKFIDKQMSDRLYSW